MKYQEKYSESKRNQALLSFQLDEKVQIKTELMGKSLKIASSIDLSEKEIIRLEDALLQEKQKLLGLRFEKENFDKNLSQICETEEVSLFVFERLLYIYFFVFKSIRYEYKTATTITESISISLEESKKLQLSANKNFNENFDNLKKVTEECIRQSEFISILERRLRQLNTKKITLEELLKNSTSIGALPG